MYTYILFTARRKSALF